MLTPKCQYSVQYSFKFISSSTRYIFNFGHISSKSNNTHVQTNRLIIQFQRNKQSLRNFCFSFYYMVAGLIINWLLYKRLFKSYFDFCSNPIVNSQPLKLSIRCVSVQCIQTINNGRNFYTVTCWTYYISQSKISISIHKH